MRGLRCWLIGNKRTNSAESRKCSRSACAWLPCPASSLTIEMACEIMGIWFGDDRRAAIEAKTAEVLETTLASLRRDRVWPID